MLVVSHMNWIDAHCHLSDPRIEPEPVLQECRRAGITRFVLGGVGPEDWERQEQLELAHPGVFFKVFGIHPWRVDGQSKSDLTRELESLARKLSSAHALGETGLDAARDRFKKSRELQLEAFEAQLDLAAGFSKPLVLHVVRAHEPALEVLERKRAAIGTGGLVHSFSGTWANARRYLDLGLTLSVSARVTFPEASDLHEVVAKTPADRLVFETDAPDQPPHGSAAKVHTPLSLLKVVEKVSLIRSESPGHLLDRSRDLLVRLLASKA